MYNIVHLHYRAYQRPLLNATSDIAHLKKRIEAQALSSERPLFITTSAIFFRYMIN